MCFFSWSYLDVPGSLVKVGYNPLTLTIDTNFLGHPSTRDSAEKKQKNRTVIKFCWQILEKCAIFFDVYISWRATFYDIHSAGETQSMVSKENLYSQDYQSSIPARWAHTSYILWSYPYKWPYKGVTGFITPICGVVTLLISARGLPRNMMIDVFYLWFIWYCLFYICTETPTFCVSGVSF